MPRGRCWTVDEDCLKLTAYFGERKRAGHQFIAGALLDLFGRHEVASSVLLRGAGGFGLKHHLRTDTTLSLSEDLPAVAVAVDTRPRIDALLAEATEICASGLLTLERARMLTGDLPPAALPEELHEATKLTVYLGRQEEVYRVPAYVAVCDLLYRRGIAGATVLLGVDGTAHGRRERARFFSRNAEVPMMVIAVGAGEQIARVLPELGGLLRHPLATLERIRVCKRDGELLEVPHPLPGVDEHGMQLWQQLMIYTSEAALHDRKPIHREILRRLRHTGASGATTIRGIWGFHGEHAPHGDRLFQRGRHVPVVTVVVDVPERIAEAFAVIDELTAERGLVTSEMLPAVAARAGEERRGGLRLARHKF
jgi:PII-like signaling protein